jgi:putative ABC transport system permease protein
MPAMLERLRVDTQSAARSLLATPGAVTAIVVTLAVSVGVNLAMFGLIDRAVLSPARHLVQPERLFTLGFIPPNAKPGSAPMTTTSYSSFTTIRDGVPALAGAAAFQRVATSVIVAGEQRRINAMIVSGEYFDLLGVTPVLGGGVHAGDDAAATAAPPVVLSYSFWRSALSSDRTVLGRRLSISGLDYSVAAVMPEGFSGHSSIDADLFVTFAGAMRDSPGWDRDGNRNFASILVRIAGDQTAAAAATQAGAAIDRRVVLQETAGSGIASTERRVAWWLGGVSVVVFLIGLANAATLLLVRAAKMRHDLAIRAALGASRARLIAQATIEATLLAVAATVVALFLALWMDDAVRRVLFPGIVARTTIGDSTLWAALAAGLMAAVAGSLALLWQVPSHAASGQLSGAGSAGGRRTRTMTSLLLVQTALSVVLLAGAGMFGGSLYQLWAQDFGMNMAGVLLIDFEQGPNRSEEQSRILASAIDRIRELPDVELATPINNIPFTGFNVPPIAVPGRDGPPSVGGQLPFLTASTPELFTILGIRIVEGRALTAADDRGAPVVIVNQTMARGVWPGESAIGKCIRIGFDPDWVPSEGPPTPSDKVPCREVVGVARDTRQRSLLPSENEARLMQYFVPFSQVPYPPFISQTEPRINGLLVRPRRITTALVSNIRRLVVGTRTDLPFVSIRPYTQVLDRQMRPWRMGTTLLGLFSALAVGVAAIGLYAAFAHAVAERRREMAIRLAVGARPAGVLRMVVGEALRLAGLGAVCGAVVAAGAGRWLQALLFGVQPSDPLVLGAAAGVMLLVAVLATWLPARTAARADPSRLLRTL